MCSSFKASLAAAVLARVDRGLERLDRRMVYGRKDLVDYAPVTKAHVAEGGLTVGELCAAAVQVSDNTAAILLLRDLGGPQALTRFWRSIGDQVTRLDRTEPLLNRDNGLFDTTTPRATAGTLKTLLLGQVLKPDSRARLIHWMETATTGPRRLRRGFPSDWVVAHKTGTGGHGPNIDIALVRPPHGAPLLVTSYYAAPKLSDEQRDAVLAEVARVVTVWRG